MVCSLLAALPILQRRQQALVELSLAWRYGAWRSPWYSPHRWYGSFSCFWEWEVCAKAAVETFFRLVQAILLVLFQAEQKTCWRLGLAQQKLPFAIEEDSFGLPWKAGEKSIQLTLLSRLLDLCLCWCVPVCGCYKEKKISGEWQARQATTAGCTSSKQLQAQHKEKCNNSKRPVASVDHCHPITEEKDKQSKPAHVTVYLFQDLNQDRSSLEGWQWVSEEKEEKWRWLSNTSK